MTTLLDLELTSRLCLTLLHSLWQVTLLAIIAWGLDGTLRSLSLAHRYTLQLGALLLAIVALPVTFLLTEAPSIPNEPLATAIEAPVIPASTPLVSQDIRPDDTPQAVTSLSPPPMPPVVETSSPVLPAMPTPEVTQPAASVETAPPWWIGLTPWIAAVYAIGVLVMLARLLLCVGRTQRLKATATPITDGPLVEHLRHLSNQLKIRVTPVLAQAERIVVPQIVGLLRPTILLPTAAINGLSLDDLEMILLHELAHVRRHDMWVNLLQRLAEVVLFFNPALWYLSRRISSLREYCCDEVTCRMSASDDSAHRTRYATALVRVAELSQSARRTTTTNELTTLAASGRTPSELRRRIAYLLGEPMNEPLGLTRGSLLTVIGVISLSLITALAGPPVLDSAAQTKNSSQPESFELIVQGPDGKPVPRALVEVRTTPQPTEEEVLIGEYVRPANYGPFVRTDDNGRLVLRMPDEQPERFNLSIKTEGFGPYWAGWSTVEHPQTIPSRFVAELEAGWSVGGVVVNGDGEPIEGVKVRPSIKYKKRPGDLGELGVGSRIMTDTEGRWRFDSVPVSMSEVFVEVSHPDFKPNRRSLTRAEFGLTLDAEPAAKVELDRGLSVTGRVVDEQGEPIEGALLRTKFLNDIREAQTNEKGEYRLSGCEPKMAKIVVSAPGKAVDMRRVQIGPDMEPVDFEMQPGGHVRIRVIDMQGIPVPKARIFFQHWREDGFRGYDYFEFDHVDQYADENGIWEWNEAPLDQFKADIGHTDHMGLGERPLIAREEEYVFRLPPPLVISGRVVDKNTGKPIRNFAVVPGVRGSPDRMNWVHGERFEATDGTFTLTRRHDYLAYLLRIEAEGYLIADSREIKSDEGDVQIDFELTPASSLTVNVLTPDNKPAAGAKVALGIAGSQINLKNGDIDDGSTYATRLNSDDEGRFSYPAQSTDYQLVITHPSGYAYLKLSDDAVPGTAQLTPWARVEGTFRAGPDTVANATLTLDTNTIHSYGEDVPNIFTHHNVTTGPDGRFVFERVVPGQGRIRRNILLIVNEGATEVTSSKAVAAEFPAGETTTIDLGGDGRMVTGKLVPPAGWDKPVLWNFALINTRVDLPSPKYPTPPADVQNDPERRKAWWAAWRETPEGLANTALKDLRDSSPYFTTTVARDGTFRIDDVPPGDYVLTVHFSQHAPGVLQPYRFSVPGANGDANGQTIDLGTLSLEGPDGQEPRQADPKPEPPADARWSKVDEPDGALVHMNVVIAKHVMLLEGREIITWEELEKKIAELADPSLAYPHLYETRGARESGEFEKFRGTFRRIREKYKLKGNSEGSLWPRTDWRYDKIETAEDLIPDESLRIDGTIVDSDGNPVEGAEVILVTPVDESISYKSYHIALVEGRVRNQLEHVLTHSDRDGQFAHYPPKETPYYVLALHSEHGIALVNDQTFAEKQELRLLDWSGLVVGLSEETEEQQADLSTRVKEYGGRPEIVLNQYWSDLKLPDPKLVFRFMHVPPIWETSVSRSFENPDGGSTGLSGASVGLIPGETRRLDLGTLSPQQHERLKSIRERSRR